LKASERDAVEEQQRQQGPQIGATPKPPTPSLEELREIPWWEDAGWPLVTDDIDVDSPMPRDPDATVYAHFSQVIYSLRASEIPRGSVSNPLPESTLPLSRFELRGLLLQPLDLGNIRGVSLEIPDSPSAQQFEIRIHRANEQHTDQAAISVSLRSDDVDGLSFGHLPQGVARCASEVLPELRSINHTQPDFVNFFSAANGESVTVMDGSHNVT